VAIVEVAAVVAVEAVIVVVVVVVVKVGWLVGVVELFLFYIYKKHVKNSTYIYFIYIYIYIYVKKKNIYKKCSYIFIAMKNK
jgi:hypothetical protein